MPIKPRTFELFQTLGVLDEVQKLATPIPTMRAYKLPGGTVPVKTWDLYEKSQVWPDRPFVSAILRTAEQGSPLNMDLSVYRLTAPA
jgi:hypothetical protein